VIRTLSTRMPLPACRCKGAVLQYLLANRDKRTCGVETVAATCGQRGAANKRRR